MPLRITRCKGRERGDHQQKDSPKQMMDMQAAFRDQVVNGQNLVVDDISQSSQEHETNDERNQSTQCYLPSQTQFLVVMLQPADIYSTSHLLSI